MKTFKEFVKEAKWVTDPEEPATGLKRGDSVYHRENGHTLRTATYLQTDTKNGDHIIKHKVQDKDELAGGIRRVKAKDVFRDPGDAWKNPYKV